MPSENHPQKLLRIPQINFFSLLPLPPKQLKQKNSRYKMWPIDQLFIELGVILNFCGRNFGDCVVSKVLNSEINPIGQKNRGIQVLDQNWPLWVSYCPPIEMIMPAYSTRQWPSLDSGSSGPSVFEPFGYMISVVLRYFFPSYPPKQKQNFNSHLIASFFETGAIATLSKSRNSTIVGQEVPNI